MGRKKIPMKPIEDKVSRRVTFSKRRTGLIKKARDLSILCHVDVALVVFSSTGKMYDFSTTGDSLDEIVQRYKEHSRAEGRHSTSDCEAAKTEKRLGITDMTFSELLEIVDRKLEEPCIDELSFTELLQLEEKIQTALLHTRSIKAQLMMKQLLELEEQERKLLEENQALKEQLAASALGGNKEGMYSPREQPSLLQLL